MIYNMSPKWHQLLSKGGDNAITFQTSKTMNCYTEAQGPVLNGIGLWLDWPSKLICHLKSPGGLQIPPFNQELDNVCFRNQQEN